MVWVNSKKETLARVEEKRVIITTYLAARMSVVSSTGSSTAPDSSVAFEISNITRDVAHTTERYWSAWSIPGPARNHQQTRLQPVHDGLRTFSAAKTEHEFGVRFRILSHEPFWQELARI